jgi:hypothetical protein
MGTGTPRSRRSLTMPALFSGRLHRSRNRISERQDPSATKTMSFRKEGLSLPVASSKDDQNAGGSNEPSRVVRTRSFCRCSAWATARSRPASRRSKCLQNEWPRWARQELAQRSRHVATGLMDGAMRRRHGGASSGPQTGRGCCGVGAGRVRRLGMRRHSARQARRLPALSESR